MKIISVICVILMVMAMLATPILATIFIVRWCMRKKKLWIGIATLICVNSILPLLIAGVFTDPATYCNHEYVITEEVSPTCTEDGKIVKVCPLCDRKSTEYPDKLNHLWETDTVVQATCTNGGYKIDRCTRCSATQKSDTETALGHSMKDVSRTEPTYETDGKIVTQCDRCGHEEITVLDKLELETIKFDGLELSFGNYSFTEVDNRYSEHYGKPVVKIPVTIKNISKEPHSLLFFYYSLFGVTGVESADIYYYFSDDVSEVGELLPGASCTAYFHILYDGDGVYTIVFDNWLYDKKMVEITITK